MTGAHPLQRLNGAEDHNNKIRRGGSFRKFKSRWTLWIAGAVLFVFIHSTFSTSRPTRTTLTSYGSSEVATPRSSSSESGSGKPIMYTFYTSKDFDGPEFISDQVLLSIWSRKWTDAGWETRILTMDDAKKHPRFEEFELKLRGVPLNGNNVVFHRLCFFRWLAVAAVGGGWMSDIDVFPLEFNDPDKYFKNGGFTMYSQADNQASIPCLMSGSALEWERLAFALLDNGANHQNEYIWSDLHASSDIYQQNHDAFQLLSLVGDAKKVRWNMYNCHKYDQKLAVHFSRGAAKSMGLSNNDSRSILVDDWLNQWRAKCKDDSSEAINPNRPIMYTFYTLKFAGGADTLGDQPLLSLWKQKWNEAGWDARILTLDDAKKHPRFKEYEEKVEGIKLRKHDTYNRLCFHRWLAVAAVGGGWMSDIDVLPLSFYNPDEYYQDGSFTIYSAAPRGGIPCLMSGKQSEWERLAFAVVDNGLEQQKSWTDMFATVDLYSRYGEEVYKLMDLMGEVRRIEWNEDLCNQYDQKLAAHFSHGAMHQNLGLEDVNLRYEMAKNWMNEWEQSCKRYETVEDS